MGDNDFATGYALGADSGGNNNSGGMWGGDGWWAIIIFAMIFGWGNGGWGGCFGGGNGAQGALTRSDLCSEFAFNDLQNGVRGISQGICDSTFALNNNMNTLGMNMMQGFNGVDNAICTLGYQNQAGFNSLANQLSSCCCETQRAIDGVNYNMATNTCNIIQNAHNDTDRVIAKLDAMEMSRKDETIYALREKLQTAQFQASQTAQNGYIDAVVNSAVAQLRQPQPVPSYTVPAPYPYCNCNSGCGCNSGCC